MLTLLLLLCDAAPALNSPLRWEKDIRAMERQDAKTPPAEGAVFFCGSSSIVRWDLPKSFPALKTVKRGFGGSTIADSAYYASRLLTAAPSAIVFYAGDNDVAAGRSAERVHRDFKAFVAAVRAKHPEVPIHVVAAKPSVARWKMWPTIRRANGLIAAECAKGERLTFIDVVPAMLASDGTPRPELFVKDGLHLSPAGYAIWNAAVLRSLGK